MSLIPGLGHLYHDGNLNNVFTNLDVQDKLRTREMNAREAKSLDKYIHVIDRAQKVCKRRNEHEQRFVREELTGIKWKTQTLKSSLKQESQRMKRQKLHKLYGPDVKLPSIHGVHGSDVTYDVMGYVTKKNLVVVSDRSIYSSGDRARNYSAPEQRRMLNSRESGLNQSWRCETSARAPSYVRRSEQVATSLHKLFEQSKERKLRESEMTVLDVLGKGSKEELEKALFVLRGTTIGNAIEDILHHRRMVTQKTSTRASKATSISSASSSASRGDSGFDVLSSTTDSDDDKVSTTPSGDLSLRLDYLPTETNLLELNSSHSALKRGQELPKIFPKIGSYEEPETELTHMFRRGNSVGSSVMANASDKSSVAKGASMKWTEIFKAPELWKQSQQNKRGTVAQKTLSLVTLTGKRRQTLLKR